MERKGGREEGRKRRKEGGRERERERKRERRYPEVQEKNEVEKHMTGFRSRG